MNNLEYLTKLIKRSIPKEVIARGFQTTRALSTIHTNVDFRIQQTILQEWVLSDIDMVAGVETNIDLIYASYNSMPDGVIVEIPLSATGGKAITSFLSIGIGTNVSGGGNTLLDAIRGPEAVADSRIVPVGPNSFYIEGLVSLTGTYLRCMLANDSDFTNLSPRAMPALGELAVLAAKAHLYNELNIAVSKGEIVSGAELGRLSSVIDEYADSLDMYNELLKSWPKINLMQDSQSHNRLIRLLMPH